MPGNDFSTTHDGTASPTWNTNTCDSSEYQTVVSHGNAVVSDSGQPTDIQYNPGFALLTASGEGAQPKTGVVHIPIAAPASLVKNLALLKFICVKFTSVQNAMINNVILQYDSDAPVATANVNKSRTFNVEFTEQEGIDAGYNPSNPQGICLTLELNFPTETASISLVSAELVYRYQKVN